MIRTLLCSLALAAAARAQGIKIEISGAERAKYRIAVPRPAGDAAAAAEVEAAVAGDLRITGLFDVLDPRGFLANLAAEGMGIAAQDWLAVGAQGVVKAQVARGGEIELHARFFEVARPGKPALEKTYRGADARKLAHQFANDLYEHLTGEKGIFLTRIAFVRPHSRGGDIAMVDAGGGREATLVANGTANLLPSWSPGGGTIAYTSLLWQNPDAFALPLGGRGRRFSKQPGLNLGPVFSPDGKHVALTLSKDGNAELYLVRADDGTIVRRLTDSPAIDTSPSFSPDGSRLAFVSARHGSPQVFVMSVAGGEAKRVTYQGGYNQAPRWCPRGDVQWIAFTGRDERYRFDVFVLDLAKGKVARVTQGQGDNYEPTWAPNGRLLAFASSRGGLWVATPDGDAQTQIVKGGAETPAWGPVSK